MKYGKEKNVAGIFAGILFSFIVTSITYAQNSDMTEKIADLMNQARTSPKEFLKQNKTEIEKLNSKYSYFLENITALPPLKWDKGLEEMAREVVEEQNFNPQYNGELKHCGFSSSRGNGSLSQNPLKYICDIYKLVHSLDYTYFGAYFNEKINGFCFQWGLNCQQKKIKYSFYESIDTSHVNFEALNTGKNADYLSHGEKKMLQEINFVRVYPQLYAKIVSQFLANESDTWGGLYQSNYEAGIELIDELLILKPRAVLQPSECIYKAAKIHAVDCQKRGFFEHIGSDGSYPWDRILKQCPDFESGNENGAGNPSSNPRAPVIDLLLDAGIPKRGHRYNMLNEKWKYCACFSYKDEKYGYFWIQNFAY